MEITVKNQKYRYMQRAIPKNDALKKAPKHDTFTSRGNALCAYDECKPVNLYHHTIYKEQIYVPKCREDQKRLQNDLFGDMFK